MPFPWLTRHINTNYTDRSSFRNNKRPACKLFPSPLSVPLPQSKVAPSGELCFSFANLQSCICGVLLTCGNAMIKCEGKGDFYLLKLLLSVCAAFPSQTCVGQSIDLHFPLFPLVLSVCWVFFSEFCQDTFAWLAAIPVGALEIFLLPVLLDDLTTEPNELIVGDFQLRL